MAFCCKLPIFIGIEFSASVEWKGRVGLVKFVLFTLFLVPFVGVGLFNMGQGAREVWLAAHSDKWPATKAQILTSKVGSQSGGRKRGTTYQPEVVYRYKVADVEHTAKRIFFGRVSSSNSARAQQYVSKYGKGTFVEIRYDRRNPAEAVIEPGLVVKTFARFVHGAVFFTLGSGCIAVLWLRFLGGEADRRKFLWVYGICGGVLVVLLILAFGVMG